MALYSVLVGIKTLEQQYQTRVKKVDLILTCRIFCDNHLYGLVVRVPGYWTEMYCVSCEVQTNLYMLCRVDRLCGLVARVPVYISGGPGSDFRGYQIFWEVVSLERAPLSLVSTIEELLGRKSSGSGLESREYGRGYPFADHATPNILKSWH
jgi:hypothetical protein